MPASASLALSVGAAAIYAVLFANELRRQDGVGRLYLLITFVSLFVFFALRAWGYMLLIDPHTRQDTLNANELFRFSGYAPFGPAILAIFLEWRR